MRQKILTVLAMVVALLAVYTLAFRMHPAAEWAGGDQAAAAQAGRTTRQARRAAARTAPAPAATPAAEPKTGVGEKDFWDAAAQKAPEDWGSDPFVRDWVMVNELAEFSLRAIALGGEKPYVLINDQILEEGDQISGKRIIKIESEKVILEQGGRTFNLLLGE